MTASQIFTAAHLAAAKAHTPQFGDVRSYREVFAFCLRAAHVDARRAVSLPLPCANFYTAEVLGASATGLDTIFFATQKGLKDFVEANFNKGLSLYARVYAWWGDAAAMQRDIALTGGVSWKAIAGSHADDAEYRELGGIDASAYVGRWPLAATEAEEQEIAATKAMMAAKFELAGIEVDLD